MTITREELSPTRLPADAPELSLLGGPVHRLARRLGRGNDLAGGLHPAFELVETGASSLNITENIPNLIGDSSCQFAETVKWNGFAFQSRREPQTNVVQNEEDERFCSILR